MPGRKYFDPVNVNPGVDVAARSTINVARPHIDEQLFAKALPEHATPYLSGYIKVEIGYKYAPVLTDFCTNENQQHESSKN